MPLHHDPLLRVEHLTKCFGGVTAVNHCSFELTPHRVTGVIGPNGSGKTTTFNLISGLEKPDDGSIVFDGEPLERLTPHAISARGIGRTFQITRVFPAMTVMENLVVACPDAESEEAVERAMGLLELVGLADLADEFGGNLSYGQSKLVEMSRVHMPADHRLILLDEPFAGVNRTLAETLLGYLRRMRDEKGMTYAVIDHEMKLLLDLSDHVIVMDHGQVLTDGPPDAVRDDERVLEAYFGSASR